MKNTLSLVLLCLSGFLTAQNFYDLNTVQTIEITFAESNWDQLLDAAYASTGDYIMAQSVSINGEVFDSVGVKYKGNSTYQSNQTKNPFHIELDTYKDHIYEAYTDIKLSNVAKDPSFLREVLSYQILRQYMDAPLSNYANVYVNGSLIGLYSNSESISKKFVDNRFYSKNNTFVKCNPPAGAGPQSNDFPSLEYLGQDSTDYYDAYEIKSDAGWGELIDLCDTLVNNLTDIEEILDVDRALWMLAFNNTLVNLDSYSGQFVQNYYLYRDHHGRFLPVVWDLNESFGRFSMSGSGNLNGTTAKQQMSHLLHENDANYPLIQQLLSVPTYKKKYVAHMKTMLEENFENGTYYQTGLELQNLIDNDVQADQNKFFTYNNFQDNLTSDVGGGGGPGGGATIGIANLMDGRSAYLLNLGDFTATAPTISGISNTPATAFIGESNSITASVINADEVILAYRTEDGAPFEKLEMFDDGAHDDGAANDGIYGASILISATSIQYYIYAENGNAGMFSPQRAEHEFYTIEASTVDPIFGDLVINEFMASNTAAVADQDGEFDDWIEIYNKGNLPINLDGYSLSDNANNLTKWTFPSGLVIQADSYLIVWADDDELQTGLHTDFKLSSTGESIYLLDNTNTIIDKIDYQNQVTDVSFGRFPNGTGDFQSMPFTFASENMVENAISAEFNFKILLEGNYQTSTGLMSTDLQADNLLPNTHPYSNTPWNAPTGSPLVSFPINTVDWILVEAYSGTPAASGASGLTLEESQIGLLLADGSIVAVDGNTGLIFTTLRSDEDYYFIVRHRNHLDIMTAEHIRPTQFIEYDFTDSVDSAFGVEQLKPTSDGKFAMYGGDFMPDGVIQATDFSDWFLSPSILNTYELTDGNIDGVVQTTDYDLWFFNKAKIGTFEIQY